MKQSLSERQEDILLHLTTFIFFIKLGCYQVTREQYHSPCLMFCQSARVDFNSQTAQVGFSGYGSIRDVVYLVYRTYRPSLFRTQFL